ncbi:MAG: response regulator [Planctomycetota bacterium]
MSDVGTMTRTRVLLIEDNFLAAMTLRSILERLECDVIGPLATIKDSARVAAEEHADVAFLDISLIGGSTFAVAETLLDKGCRVVFVTGYDNPITLPPTLKDVPILRKPVEADAIRHALER